MTLRHAAALAIVGWYLMAPPFAQDGKSVLKDAPLPDWGIIGSFDSATACEGGRKYMRAYVNNANLQAQARKQVEKRGHISKQRLGEERTTASKCIGSDDPRLAK